MSRVESPPSDTELNPMPGSGSLRRLMVGRYVVEPKRTLRLVVTVEDFWRELQPDRPHDRSGIGVDSDVCEVRRVI